jgi:N-acetylglucosamine kinase-like BadF-type ATPase
MSSQIYSVGVDLGGTWIRLEAVNPQSQRIRSFKGPAPTLAHLPAFLKKHLQLWKARPRHLIVASRGVWTSAERRHLKRALRTLAPNIQVMSDVEAAWHAAFKNEGIVVIAGTGSIAYGRDSSGRSQRAGGWGPVLGDEGSGFWMGKTWLKRTKGHDSLHEILKLVKPPERAVRRIAGLAPRVMQKARRGNPVARTVLKEAQSHLVELVAHTARRLRFKKAIPLSWGGSLLNNAYFRSGFTSALKQKTGKGRRFLITSPRGTPVSTLSRLAPHE